MRKGRANEIKTDCFAFRTDRSDCNTAYCDALKELYCSNGKCGFYKKKQVESK